MVARWRGRSMAEGWSVADGWWTPEVEDAIKAVRGNGDLAQACRALGTARAAAGVGIVDGMDDLAALFAVAGREEPPFAALRAFAAGWAARGCAEFAERRGRPSPQVPADGHTPAGELATCDDPLTGLATVPYVRTRLAQLYRGSAAGMCLVIAEPYGDVEEVAERLAAALNLASALRRAFPGDETLALLAPGRVAAITRADEKLADKVAGLRATEILYGRPPWVRVRPLPRAYGQALALIRTLSLEA